ncbi:NAD(P)-binding protein [Punctularia strigosozonata HHB-11173 SS5]|uniref:NAD(P)-binding protein n=1 Tax=Punctularia strigosozonata (strain HHB-11173) TaxID=741275 RepID=UPI00044162BE|nr:NAD(P)-binding protein [Punctularia strigosozonata HHB-11173 SS5]EIN11998.1 NAD(P)-binding protein [Punctularia strigosozonata HHB-11173 SS5]
MLGERIALVTGAAQGIGRAVALRLADDGFDVAVNDMIPKATELEELQAEIEGKGRRACVVLADISDERGVQRMVDDAVATLGGLDVMVANAGITLLKGFMDTTVAEWDRLFDVNARGAMLCYQIAAKVMIKQGRGGRIVGACSSAGKKAIPSFSAYSATKYAVRAITQTAAAELGKYGITVNAYAPGPISGHMMDSMILETASAVGADPDTIKKQLNGAAAVGHTGEPRDVANLVSFLASQESRFITGQTIVCDGGVIYD